jgi:hypothetical protein
MEPHEAEMDILLRRSMNAPVPGLPPNFDRRVMREVRRKHQSLDRYNWILFTGYGVISAVTSVVVMRGAGLNWLGIGATLGPVTLLAAAYSAWQANHGRWATHRAPS